VRLVTPVGNEDFFEHLRLLGATAELSKEWTTAPTN